MAKYVLVFMGGRRPASEEEGQLVTAAWAEWFESLGDAVVDHGNPFGPSKTVGQNDMIQDGASGATGYAIIRADNFDGAVGYSRLCPHLQAEGTIEVYETFDVM